MKRLLRIFRRRRIVDLSEYQRLLALTITRIK